MRTEQDIIKEIEELGWDVYKVLREYHLYKDDVAVEVGDDYMLIYNSKDCEEYKYYEPTYVPKEIFNLIFELMILELEEEEKVIIKRSKEEIFEEFKESKWEQCKSKGIEFYNRKFRQTIEIIDGGIASYNCYCEDDYYGTDTYESNKIYADVIWLIKELLDSEE